MVDKHIGCLNLIYHGILRKITLIILSKLYKLQYELPFFLLYQAYQQLDEPHLAQMNFSWALSLDPQGTNSMIKEAMNQQRFTSLENSTIDEDEEFTMDNEEDRDFDNSEHQMSDS